MLFVAMQQWFPHEKREKDSSKSLPGNWIRERDLLFPTFKLGEEKMNPARGSVAPAETEIFHCLSFSGQPSFFYFPGHK